MAQDERPGGSEADDVVPVSRPKPDADRRAGVQWFRRLSASDWVNIVSLLVNVVVLIVALFSLYVAVQAYRDAQSSGDKQLAALEASRASLTNILASLKTQQGSLDQARIALEASVSNAVAQLDVLQTSLRTSRRQLEVLEAQWKRQLEQPDLHAILVYPQEPAAIFVNRSKVKVATGGYFQLIALNVDHWDQKNLYQRVTTATTDIGPMRPSAGHLPQHLRLLLEPDKPPLEPGNRLFGYFVIECPECVTHRVYWLLIRYGQEGWFREMKATDTYPSISGLMSLTPAMIEAEINRFLGEKDLTRMAERLPFP